MSAGFQSPLAERFRETDTPYLSPVKIGEFFGFRIQELAERAHVHRNTPSVRPYAPQLQRYLQDLVRVLAIAAEMTGDERLAVFLLRNEPLRAFGYKTADTLIRDGRIEALIAYLESFSGGATG